MLQGNCGALYDHVVNAYWEASGATSPSSQVRVPHDELRILFTGYQACERGFTVYFVFYIEFREEIRSTKCLVGGLSRPARAR